MTTSSITISVRRSGNQLVGITESDRWNLATLAHHYSNVPANRANLDANKATTPSKVTNYRRALASLGFTLQIVAADKSEPVKASKPRKASAPSKVVSPAVVASIFV